MGMIGIFVQASMEQLYEFEKDSAAFITYIYSEEVQNSDAYLDVDKAWHAINYCLTGKIDGDDEDNPLSFVVFGGAHTIDADMGYGAPFTKTANQVEKANEALKRITKEDLRANYDVQQLLEAGVYPIMEEEDEEEFFMYLWDSFQPLTTFFETAAQKGNGVLFFIS